MGKRALIHATEYQDIYKFIVAELENQGWEVDVVKDRHFEGDPKYNSSRLAKFVKQYVKFGKYKNWEPRVEQFWGGNPLSFKSLRYIHLYQCPFHNKIYT
ncbi:MAG: hypothetical protein HDR74_00355 [Bacteroides sp.]|nr:hypothetical protein [Bacteroides sp.]